jgi:hypothetical protein
MSSLNSSPVDTNALNGSFQCAAGVYCLLPLVNYPDSCHRCFFCKGTLHGPCGVLHDPDNITYQNRCNLCDNKYFSNKRIPSNQTALLTPPPVNAMTHPARSTTQTNLMYSVEVMNSEDLILKIRHARCEQSAVPLQEVEMMKETFLGNQERFVTQNERNCSILDK